MKAELTIQYFLDFYPQIYPTRKHVLNQLLCVTGNGFRWGNNGELEPKCELKYLSRWKPTGPIDRAVESESIVEMYNDSVKRYNFLLDAYGDCENVEYKVDEPLNLFHWYPLSEKHSKIYTYPDNITDDWKAVVDECIALLKGDGVVVVNKGR